MALFGFLGEAPDPSSWDALVAHGVRRTGRPTSQLASGTGTKAACWAPVTLAEDSVFIALQGEPIWARGEFDEAVSAATLLAEYRRHGSRVVDRLAGRFALAIVDPGACRAVLAVDPMGIERMAYAVRGASIIFSSSARVVASTPGLEAPISNQSVFEYLLLHVVPAPGTVFEGVQKLRPATCLTFERGKIEIRRYWRPDFHDGRSATFETLRQDLMASLRAAIRHCRPDHRTGAFLSGGLDSSSVAGVLSEIAPPPTRTFSIGFGFDRYDELPYARIANQRFGCEGHEHIIDGRDIVNAFPLIARAFDEPFGNSSALAVYYCARLAHEHEIDHLLAGDGGDELFAGNSRYAEQRVFGHYRLIPSVLREGVLEPLLERWPQRLQVGLIRTARGYIAKANTSLPERLESWNILYRAGAHGVLHDDLLASVDPTAPIERMNEVWNATPSSNTLHRMLFYDWQYTLADNDLRKVESMCALAGVRASYPMLHPRVIAMSTRVPPRMMMPGGRLRHFYKHAMRGFLPDAIIEKKKHGFGLPFGLWLAQNLQLRDLIFSNLASLRARRIVRNELIDRLLNLHRSDDASYYGVFVWVLAMLEQWLRDHGRGNAV